MLVDYTFGFSETAARTATKSGAPVVLRKNVFIVLMAGILVCTLLLWGYAPGADKTADASEEIQLGSS